MATVQIHNQRTAEVVRLVQGVTIVWMSVEALLSLWAAWRARSPALAAFGGDSAVELMSAVVVLWRFRSGAPEDAERRAARIAAGLLFGLAACVIFIATLSLLGYSEPTPSYLGIVVLVIASIVMPLLSLKKRRLSALTGSSALRADAAQSALCGYLSLVALLGLVVHVLWHVEWADPVAALAITPFILHEAIEATRGKACGCC